MPESAPLYKTGKSGNASIASIPVQITEWKTRQVTTFSDTTSSASYDPETDSFWTSQSVGSTTLDGSISGWYDFSGPDATQSILNSVLRGVPVAITLGLDQSTRYCSGLFNLMNFDLKVNTVSGTDTLGFTCDIINNGRIMFFPA